MSMFLLINFMWYNNHNNMKKIHRFLLKDEITSLSRTSEDKDLVHIIRNVLKIEPGEKCIFFSDRSDDYLSNITEVKKDIVSFEVISTISKKKILKNITACISITKRDNFELVVQKLTELGVKTILPIISDRTIKQSLKTDRLQKISDEALEQSGGSSVVYIEEPISLKEALEKTKELKSIYFDMESPKFEKQSENNLAFYIGPEGGWSENDLELFKEYKIDSYSLGETVLRAETASIICAYKLLWD